MSDLGKETLEKIKEICLEWYRDGIDDGYYSCETGTNAMDAFYDILRLLGVSQEEMDDFDQSEYERRRRKRIIIDIEKSTV